MMPKFRVWDGERMRPVEAMMLRHWDGAVPGCSVRPAGSTEWLESEDCPVVQYTGIKDDIDAELYFDDVAETYYGTRTSERRCIATLDDLLWLVAEQRERGMWFRILGSIHQHPHLLSVKEETP